MITKIFGGKVVTDRKIEEKNVYFEDDKILAVTDAELPYDKGIDAKGMYVAPAFVDIHTHGAAGHDFLDKTEEAYFAIAKAHAQHGAGTILPTITSAGRQRTLDCIKTFETIRGKAHDGANMPGLHLEGPYFSLAQAGAQDPDKIRSFDAEEYMEILNTSDAILRWTGAPELDGSAEFASALTERGVLPCIGHSDADGEAVKEAFKNGFTHVTHLYSATSTVHRKNAYRHIGIVECAYLLDDMTVEIIADGKHLPADLLKFIVKFKDIDKICLITDSMRGAGMPEGTETILGGKEDGLRCIIDDSVAKLPDCSAFAGSVSYCDRLVRTMVNLAQVPIEDAVYMLTETPARFVHLDTKGRLAEGMDADIVLFDADVNIAKTIVGGRTIYEK